MWQMQLYFSGCINVRMMHPERIRERGVKPSRSSNRGRQAFLLTPVAAPFLLIFVINPTPSVTITPLAVTPSLSCRPTCQKMTGIKYDTQSLCHHCREGHFPLEWNGGRCRVDIFWQTGLMQRWSLLTYPQALISENHNMDHTHICSVVEAVITFYLKVSTYMQVF